MNKEVDEYQAQGKKIESEGYKAGIAKQPPSTNPYPAGQWKYEIWEEGRSRGIDNGRSDESPLALWNE